MEKSIVNKCFQICAGKSSSVVCQRGAPPAMSSSICYPHHRSYQNYPIFGSDKYHPIIRAINIIPLSKLQISSHHLSFQCHHVIGATKNIPSSELPGLIIFHKECEKYLGQKYRKILYHILPPPHSRLSKSLEYLRV